MDAAEGPGWLHPYPFFLGNGLLGLNSRQTLGFIFGSHPSFHLNWESFPDFFFFCLIHVDFHSSWIQIRVGICGLWSSLSPGFPRIYPCSTHAGSQQDFHGFPSLLPALSGNCFSPIPNLLPPCSRLIPIIPCSFLSIWWNIPSSGIQLESRRTPGKPLGEQQEGPKKALE